VPLSRCGSGEGSLAPWANGVSARGFHGLEYTIERHPEENP
jgi:hypothetical protein